MRLLKPSGTAKADPKWEPEAEKALTRVPRFIRPLVRRKVRERVSANGGSTVTLADFQEAENRFRSLTAGKTEKELESVMPQENKKGASLVHVEACRAQALDCPNSLVDLEPWVQAIRDWAAEFDLSEKLRAMVDHDKVLFHHKLKFSLSGCPNGCSRPQIADFGLRGRTRPLFEAEECTSCKACVQACPDNALNADSGPPEIDGKACLGCFKCSQACPSGCISLFRPKVELLVGGKLGRHPHLARPAGLFSGPEELIAGVEKRVGEYLNGAQPGQRFADYCLANG